MSEDENEEDELFKRHLPRVKDPENWKKRYLDRNVFFDDKQMGLFLEDLSNFGFKNRAARVAGVTPELVEKKIKEDTDFAKSVAIALQNYSEHIQGVARKQFAEGVDNIKVNRGQIVKDDKGNTIVEKVFPNNPMMQMELKRVNPEFREKTEIDLNIQSGVLVAPAMVSVEDWIAKNAKIHPDDTDGDAKPK